MNKTYKTILKEVSLGFLDSKLKNLVNFGKYGYKTLEEAVCFLFGVVLSPLVLPILALVHLRKQKQ